MAARQLPGVPNQVDASVFAGGVDLISPSGSAAPGTARFATNYEAEFGGGYRRLGGFERIDGRPAPHDATYIALKAAAGFTGVVVGNTLVGATSAATGRVVYLSLDATLIAVTKVTGVFGAAEAVKVLTVTVGTVTDNQPALDGFIDNELSELAANVYRTDILKPPGTGVVVGVAVLNNVLYCWRVVSANLVTYKATAAGWVVVPQFSQIGFNGGSSAYSDGGVLTQGGASATIKRVVHESGSWSGGTAAGRLIIEPVTGTFTAGIAGGGGVANLTGPASVVPQFAGGRVQSAVYNFTASLATRRLYCCDGVNLEWEFDGTVIVPLTTGMAGIRATQVIAHKNHLFFAYRSSLQHSQIGLPYQWSAVLGAGELGTGDTITNLIGVSGSEASAALMVIGRDSTWMLYGTSTLTWQFSRISEEAGAQAGSAQQIAGAVSFDRDGFSRFVPTQAFGNFSYESASRAIDPLVRNATVKCSVLVKNKSVYRCFFSDGLFVSGLFQGKNGFAWMPCDYGVVIECAVGGEINGQYRVFYGSADGWVYEADVGRSFDGAEVDAALRLSSQNQRSPLVEKRYRHVEVQVQAESAFTLAVAGEFDDSDPNSAGVTATQLADYRRVYGAGLFWDFNSWDRAYWDVALANRLRFPIHGVGRSMSLLIRNTSTNELPHTLKVNHMVYTPRRMTR